jgi:23S rRNA (adenine2503-C2)-methyltransferase
MLLEADGVRRVHGVALWRALYHDPYDVWDKSGAFAPPLQRWINTQVRGERVSADRHLVELASTRSADGRAVKYLLRLDDGQQIETVAMGYPGRVTACVSTQAGCAMGCVFCATGQMGFTRHLRAGEIVGQVLHVHRALAARGDRLRNLVLMGMGEPLHNYDNVMQALAIVSDRGGLNIGPRRITVNTVGIVPAILRMARERQPYNLGVSLHGSTEAERAALVPVSHRWPLDDLMAACRTYTDMTQRRVFLAWTLIDGVNDSPDHAVRLAQLIDGLPAHVNLIRLNTTAGFVGRDTADAAADRFRATIRAAGIPCTIRQRRGIDVEAGCGQLAVRKP